MRRIRAIEALVATLAITGCSTLLDITSGDGTPADGGVPPRLPDGEALPEGGGEGGAVDSAVPPSVLADKLENAAALAVDDKYVWFTRSSSVGAILSVPKNGGPVATIRTGDEVSMPIAIALGPSGIYWAAKSASGAVSPGVRFLDSKGMFVASSNIVPPGGIAIAPSGVFWTRPTAGELVSSDLLLGMEVPYGPNVVNATLIAVDPSYVYCAAAGANGDVFRTLYDGNSPEAAGFIGATTYDTISALAATSTRVVWADKKGVYSAAPDSTSFTRPPTVVSSLPDVVGIVIDDAAQALYFVTGSAPGAIYRWTAGVTTLIASPACKQGSAIAHDAVALYVACSESILRVPKPK